jgi:hypothetical protein
MTNEERLQALRQEIADAYRLGRDPQRQLCEVDWLTDDDGRPLPDAPVDPADLEQFITGYVETALWSSSIEEDFARFWAAKTGENFAPDTSMQRFGFEPDAITDEAMRSIAEDCEQFLDAERADIDAYCEQLGEWHGSDSVRGADARYSGLEQAGGDFWLSRNGHGAGFWDRGLGELGERLTRAARAWGSSDLYLTDDERIHVS